MKKTLFVIMLIAILTLSLVLVACKTTPHENELPVGSINNVNVADAMNEICSALEHSVTTEGATEGIYVGFSGLSKSVDETLPINEKPILFDFSAKIYIDNANLENDTKSTLSFVVKQENGATQLAVYFANGKLYIDYPPVFSKVAIEGFELAELVNNLNESKIHDGKVKTVTDLLPVFGNYIFTSCQKHVLGECDDPNCRCKNHFEYICTLDFSKLFEGLENVLSSAKLGITADMVLATLNLTDADLSALSKLNTTVTFNTFVQKGDDKYQYFKNMTYEKVDGSVTDSFAITDFMATEFTSAVQGDYKVILPDNLSSYRAFNFANFDLSGTFTLSMKSFNGITELFGEELSSAFVKNDFSCDFSFKSNVKDGKLTVHLTLGNLFGLDKHIELFYDGEYLFVDLSAYIGRVGKDQGLLKFSDAFIKEKLKALNVLKDKEEADSMDKLYLVTSILAGLNHQKDNTKIELEKTALDLFAGLLGYDFVLDYDSAVLELNTESNLFKAIDLKLINSGLTVEISATNPKIGYEVLVETPSWTTHCTNWESLSRVTPVFSGSIDTNVSGVSNTELVESLIASLTGESVELKGNVSRFMVEANYTTSGKLDIFKINFLTHSNDLVCSIYYYTKGDNRSNELFVILPEENGVSTIKHLTMLESGRYSGFLNTINGNALVVSGMAEVVVGNHSNSLELSANKNGVSNLFAFIKKIFGDFYLSELPIDFSLANLSINLGENLTIKSTFGMNKYISLTIDDVVLDTYSLALKTTELNSHENKTVSIFDDNDMPEIISIVMGGETDTTLRVRVSDFGGWSYDKIPSLGSGITSVNAFVTAFGQKIVDVVKVDCSNAENYAVKVDMDYADYVNNDEKAFIFDRYASAVDPIYVITTKFNSVDLKLGNKFVNKQSTWSYQGTDLASATFGYGSVFTITPSITGFFGNQIVLNTCSYSLKLSDVEIQGVENADNFLTIFAYGDFDPLSPLTYQRVETFVQTKDGGRFKANLEFDVSSIKNINIAQGNKLLTNDELISALANSFYKLSGNFKITASLKNCLGVATKLDVTITVEDRIITKTTPDGLSQGVEFEVLESGEYAGVFIFDPVKISSLSSDTLLAKSLIVEYGSTKMNERNVKWELPKVNNIPLYSETILSGELSIVVGDATGGYQTFKYLYFFKSYKLNSVVLTANGKDVARLTNVEKNIEFELLAKNPYNFDCPDGIVLNHDEFTLAYKDFSKTYSADSIVFEKVNWNMPNFKDSEIWFKGENVVYSGEFTVCDRKIVLNLSFETAIVDTWVFLTADGSIANESIPLLRTPTFVEDANGEYVFVDGRYILAKSEHNALTHYSVKAWDNGSVYYKKADPNDNVLSLTIDPNKTDYLCYDSYPTTARVTFKGVTDENGDPIEFDLNLTWDLSALYNSETIKSKGYYDTVPVFIAHNQKLADVNLWISGEDPSDYYCYYDETSGSGSKVIPVKLLGTNEFGNLVVNKLGTIAMLHDAICGCNEADCLGRIYFKYEDKNTESGWFKVTEWIGLEAVFELFSKQMAKGVPVEEVTGQITLTAKVGNILCSSITLSIEKSTITLPSFENYLPYANSSWNNSLADVYSMHANGVNLTIDPYLANPKDPSNYPTRVEFYLDGVKTVGNISNWDLSCFNGLEMYLGATGTVVAEIETDFGKVKINAPTMVSERVVELVIVDGNTLPFILVNVYSETPFGENVVRENGRTIAYKRIEVKFKNDDNVYPMILKYDITDFVASHAGGVIARDIDVYVGNDAGGYQLKSGYSVYSTQNVITSIVSNDEAIKNFVSDGVIYSLENGFVLFDGESLSEKVLANNAWKHLLVNAQTLTVNYSYYSLGVEIQKTITITKGVWNNGFVFEFSRTEEGEVVLNLWNNSMSVGEVGSIQSINTANVKKIKLYETDFTLSTIPSELSFDKTMTVSEFLKKYQVFSIPESMIAQDKIVLEIIDSNGNVLSGSALLTVGNYVLKLSVLDQDFQTIVIENGVEVANSITKALTITKKEVSEVRILNGDREIFKNGNVYEIYEGSSVSLMAEAEDGFEVILTITNEAGEIVKNPEDVGTYTITLQSADENYALTVGTYTLVIKSRTAE